MVNVRPSRSRQADEREANGSLLRPLNLVTICWTIKGRPPETSCPDTSRWGGRQGQCDDGTGISWPFETLTVSSPRIGGHG